MKKALKIALFSVMGLVVLLGIAVWLEFGHLVKGANSCVKLDDGLYYMEYKGDDGFDGLMAKGGIAKADELAVCTDDAMARHDDNDRIFVIGAADGSAGLGVAYSACNIGVGTCFAVGDLPQG